MEVISTPHPPRLPVLGNLMQIKGRPFAQTIMSFAAEYGPLIELRLPGTRFFVATTHELVEELCDEKRFKKVVGGPLKELRRLIGDGLFSADGDDPAWTTAHSILLPSFSMKAMRHYFPKMREISEQMLQSWHERGSTGISVTDDCTRMTLDTIALCGFNYRFHSFQKAELHPFIDAMNRSLLYSLKRVQKTKAQIWLDRKGEKQFQDDRSLMFAIVDEVIAQRAASPIPEDHPDMLALMLEGIDRKSGKKIDYENIRYQLITFLIAGHETTSGLLAFALYYLVKNPDILAKARGEVDAILGPDVDRQAEFADVLAMRYIGQVLREALRLWPTAPGFSRTPYEPTQIGGRFPLRPGDRVLVSLASLHRDPKIWGDDPERFDPERFSPEQVKDRPDRAFRPFGTGARACIGQNFAMVEASLTLAMLLRNFEFDDYLSYRLVVQETLTLKPRDFRLKVRARKGFART